MRTNIYKLLDPLNRDKPVLFNHTIEVVTVAGQQIYNIPEMDFLRDKPIIGMVMRSFHADRRSKNGRALVNDAVFKRSFLKLMVDSKSIIDNYPLEYLVKNVGDVPGDYLPVMIENGFDPSTSSINISIAAGIIDNEAFEITFLYMNPDHIQCESR